MTLDELRTELADLVLQPKPRKQEDIAKDVGISQLALRSFLKGHSKPTQGTLMKIRSYVTKHADEEYEKWFKTLNLNRPEQMLCKECIDTLDVPKTSMTAQYHSKGAYCAHCNRSIGIDDIRYYWDWLNKESK